MRTVDPGPVALDDNGEGGGFTETTDLGRDKVGFEVLVASLAVVVLRDAEEVCVRRVLVGVDLGADEAAGLAIRDAVGDCGVVVGRDVF